MRGRDLLGGGKAEMPLHPIVGMNNVTSPPPVLQLLVVGFRILPRWRLRHIPLVKPLPFLLGHLLVFVRQPLHECYKRWAREYGSIFLVFFG